MLKIIDNTSSGFQIQNCDGITKIPALESWGWGQYAQAVMLDVVKNQLWLITTDKDENEISRKEVSSHGFFTDYNGENRQSMEDFIDAAKIAHEGFLLQSPCGNNNQVYMQEEIILGLDELGQIFINASWSESYPALFARDCGWTISSINLPKMEIAEYLHQKAEKPSVLMTQDASKVEHPVWERIANIKIPNGTLSVGMKFGEIETAVLSEDGEIQHPTVQKWNDLKELDKYHQTFFPA